MGPKKPRPVEAQGENEKALVVSLGKSKTNQLGDYDEKAIFYSPELAVWPIRSLKA